MDLMRYADTYGHEFDFEIQNAHEYRDYLIRAFNEDVPYDDLIREHLAGDLIKEPRLHPSMVTMNLSLALDFGTFMMPPMDRLMSCKMNRIIRTIRSM